MAGIFVQAEDELGPPSQSRLGFSYSGYLAVTGSARAGDFAYNIKTEAIGWASMAEIPAH